MTMSFLMPSKMLLKKEGVVQGPEAMHAQQRRPGRVVEGLLGSLLEVTAPSKETAKCAGPRRPKYQLLTQCSASLEPQTHLSPGDFMHTTPSPSSMQLQGLNFPLPQRPTVETQGFQFRKRGWSLCASEKGHFSGD